MAMSLLDCEVLICKDKQMQIYFRHVEVEFVQQIRMIKWKACHKVYHINKHWHAWNELEEVYTYLSYPSTDYCLFISNYLIQTNC